MLPPFSLARARKLEAERPEILRQQVTYLWDSLPSTLPGSTLTLVLIWFAFSEPSNYFLLTAFSLLIVAGIAHGGWMYVRWRKLVRNGADWNPKQWGLLFAICAGLAMMTWGVIYAYFIFTSSDALKEVVALVFACVMAVAVVPFYAAFFPALLLSVVSVIVPSLVVILSRGGRFDISLGVGLVVFMGVCLSAGWALRKTIRDAVSLGIQNLNLVEELRVTQSRKAKFFADANHDLRQPIHAIGLLVSELKKPISEQEKKEYIGRIESSVEGMQNLVDYLLDSAKLEAGAVTPKISEFPLSRVLQRVASHYEPIAKAKGISLRVRESDAMVRTDPALLEQILRNLVGNAISYTPRGKVLVGARKSNDVIRVSVWDQGVGIPSDKLDTVFEAFVRLGASVQSGGNVGLGLSIVKRCAELLNHPLTVMSQPNKGSTFSVSLPYVGKAPMQDDTPTEASIDAAGAFVVVVDDDHDIVYAMRRMLLGMGCHVVSGHSGDEVMRALEQHLRQPDLVICDLDLGYEETGLDVINRIRATQEVQIPALLVSGSQEKLGAIHVTEQGVLSLLKPVPEQRLKTEIARALRESCERQLAADA